MSTSDRAGEDAEVEHVEQIEDQVEDEEQGETSVSAMASERPKTDGNPDSESSPNPSPVEPQVKECLFIGSEHLFEALTGVEHGEPRSYSLDGGTHSMYLCSECWARVGKSFQEVPQADDD